MTAPAAAGHANVEIGAVARCNYRYVDISALATNESHVTVTVKMVTPYGNDGPTTMPPNSNRSFLARTKQKAIGRTLVEFVGHQPGKKQQVVWYKTYVRGKCRSSH